VQYFVLGDEDTVLGFGLVGVPGQVVTGAEEAQTAFRKVLSEREIGICIITEPIADLIRDLVESYVFTEEFPLILEIPDRQGHDEERPSLREVVNEAIGISL
jgi:V/A-type H+-transporting ATPase subunit F